MLEIDNRISKLSHPSRTEPPPVYHDLFRHMIASEKIFSSALLTCNKSAGKFAIDLPITTKEEKYDPLSNNNAIT
jgi:hypothetical protein